MKILSSTMLLLAILAGTAVGNAQERIAPERPGAPKAPESPIAAARFGISIDGVEVAQFSRAMGLEQAARMRTRANIVFSGGMIRSPKLRQWYEAASKGSGGTHARKSGAIICYDTMGKPIARYRFVNAWPAKWQGPAPKAGGNTVAVETITLTVETIEMD